MVFFFYVFAAAVMVGAGVVCFSREILWGAMGLVMVLLGVAGLFLLLSAEFLAAVQLAVFVGGAWVMILVGMVLTRKTVVVERAWGFELLRAVVMGAFVAGALIGIFVGGPWAIGGTNGGPVAAKELCAGMVSAKGSLVAVELMSVLLLTVMIGGAYLARSRQAAEPAKRVRGKPIQTAPEMEKRV